MKTQDEKEYEINGEKVMYTFTQMVPEEATRVALRIMKIAGLQVGGALGSLQLSPKGVQAGEDLNIDMGVLGESIGKMFQQIDEDETIDTIKKLLSCVLVNAKPLNMNSPIFQGQTLHLMNVVQHSGRVNFSDFFDASSGVVDMLKKVVTTTLAKATSTGPTGDS